MNNNTITIAMVCDNHFIVMLAALIKSIEKSHIGNKLINIYVVNDGISKSNINKIKQTISSKNLSLFWIRLKDAIPENSRLPLDNSTYPLNTYVRLFLFHFLPISVNRAIYLDVDMIVLKDIECLWDMDIDNHVIAAVIDIHEKVSMPLGGIKNYKELGIHPDTKYFNSGLLLVDLHKWREMNVTNLILETIESNKNFVAYPDQYGLNVVFANNWYELNPKWNNFAYNIESAPYLVHFIAVKPIFKGYYFDVKYKNMFYEFLKLTPWANYTPRGDYVWQLKKIRNMIRKKSWDTLTKKTWVTLTKRVVNLIN